MKNNDSRKTLMSWKDFSEKYCERQVNTPENLAKDLRGVMGIYTSTGFLLLECQMLDSSRMGELTILGYGGAHSLKEIPTKPFSPRGLASDMSVVIGVLPAMEVPGVRFY